MVTPFLFLPDYFCSPFRLWSRPKPKSKTRPHNERSRGPSRSSPRGSVQASSAASHSLVSTLMQLNESEAVPSPSSVAAPQGCAAQGMPVESSLPSQLLETLVAKIADRVSPRFATVLPAQPTTLGSSQLTEVAACSSSSTSRSTFTLPSTNGSAPIHSSASPEDIASSVIQQSAANAANSLTEEHWLSSIELNLFTDASGSLGFAAIFGSHWSHGKWPPGWEQKNIAFLGILSHCFEFASVGRGYV